MKSRKIYKKVYFFVNLPAFKYMVILPQYTCNFNISILKCRKSYANGSYRKVHITVSEVNIMNKGKFFQDTSITLFVLAIIGSLILGNKYAIPGSYSFMPPTFNWPICLGCIISSFLLCLFLYTLGEIVNQLENISENTCHCTERLIPSGHIKGSDASSPATPPVPPIKEGQWTCSCGQANSEAATYCVSCGKYR